MSNYVSYEVFNGFAPSQGSRAMTITPNFALANPFEVNLTQEAALDRLEFVQSFYVDNSANTAALTIFFTQTQQTIVVPAGAQGYVPALCPNSPIFTIRTSGTPTVTVIALNFPVPSYMWNQSISVSVSMAGGNPVDYSVSAPLLGTLITTIPANTNRKMCAVQNQSANQIQVVLDDGAGNNEAVILLAAGGANVQGSWFDSEQHKGRVRVYGSGATEQVCAYEI